MTPPSCTLSIFAARTDLPFMLPMVRHIVKMSRYPFVEKFLAIDTAPLTGDKVFRKGIGTLEELRECCDRLIAEGVVDRAVDINYDPAYRDRVYRKHLGAPVRQTHNYKGYPILGSAFKIETSASDYALHYDGDMLIYQEPDYSWIEAGIEMMREHPEIIAIRPLTGPPLDGGSRLLAQKNEFDRHPDGFYRFKFFSSRCYLIDRKRFDKILPLPILWRKFQKAWMNVLPIGLQTLICYISGKGFLESWEILVSRRLEDGYYVRAVLDSPKAWVLHTPDHGPEFVRALPDIIQKVESGWYPPEQAGKYDLILPAWTAA